MCSDIGQREVEVADKHELRAIHFCRTLVASGPKPSTSVIANRMKISQREAMLILSRVEGKGIIARGLGSRFYNGLPVTVWEMVPGILVTTP